MSDRNEEPLDDTDAATLAAEERTADAEDADEQAHDTDDETAFEETADEYTGVEDDEDSDVDQAILEEAGALFDDPDAVTDPNPAEEA